jgi:hypothetical protein
MENPSAKDFNVDSQSLTALDRMTIMGRLSARISDRVICSSRCCDSLQRFDQISELELPSDCIGAQRIA